MSKKSRKQEKNALRLREITEDTFLRGTNMYKDILDSNREYTFTEVENAVMTKSISAIHNFEDKEMRLNPYMIGMAYLRRICQGETLVDNRNSPERAKLNEQGYIGHINLTQNISKIEETLRNQSICEGPLTGVIYISASLNFTGIFAEAKATLLGLEVDKPDLNDPRTRCSAHLVANFSVGFAVVGKDLEARHDASFLNLYTFTFSSIKSFTVIARSFHDLQTIASAINFKIGLTYPNTKDYWRNQTVIVELGRQKEYEFDKVLYKLSLKLKEQGHPIQYAFLGCDEEQFNVDSVIMLDENQWTLEKNKKRTSSKREYSTSDHTWVYTLTPVNTIFQAGYKPSCTLSLPIKETIESIEIQQRKNGDLSGNYNLFDFARKVELLLLNIREEVFPRADND